MDQVKIGKFIAQLRREHHLTQEALGAKLGVTNKTISRWENGNYMPDIEMFQLLSREFNVSINELISGERLSDDKLREEADKNLVSVWKSGSFSIKDQLDFWKKKWLKEHALLIVTCIISIAAIFAYGWIESLVWLLGVSPLISVVLYAVLRNQMMIYVEKRAFKSPE
ncbi:MAG TPA: helix-turn-helix transcriptional regulator [Clostridiaceae bacterium]|jgi:transcriptional regulator with XRE-family HTH domain|nr:helix-turn-helix transcriptional regulator [Clostridiaceae bacterium]